MGLATVNDRCMFFVGGNKAKSSIPTGQALAGGCTKEWWDDKVAYYIGLGGSMTEALAKEFAMGDLMGTDGEPVDSSAVDHFEVTSGEHTGKTQLFGISGFSNSEAGMLLYHPNTQYPFSGGKGFYKILESIDTGNIIIDLDWGSIHFSNDGDVCHVGGAWSSIDTLCESYIDAFDYSQEVWVNKDLSPTAQWDWADWSGDVYNNTWFKVTGFHRVPGDITEPGGAYFQTAKDMYDNGVHANKLVGVDMSGLSGDLIDPDWSENITVRGFYFNDAPAGIAVFDLATSGCQNIHFEHNAFELSYRLDFAKFRNLLMIDSCIIPSAIYADVIINTDATSVVILLNNYITHDASTAGMNIGAGAIYFGMGNIIDVEGASIGLLSNTDSLAISLNNTYIGFDGVSDMGVLRVNHSASLVSINDIVLNKIASAYALEVAKYGGSFITKNLCAYSEAGQLTEVIELHPDEPTGNIRKHDIDNLLEVDPLLDGDYEPLEEQVRIGGTPDVLGDPKTIGAIQTMNTTVINTAVQAALTSQGYTSGRAPKLDNLDDAISDVISALGSLDSIKLGADGLDDLVISEPTGDPDTWSVPQKLMWLIMRFMNKHTSDNFSGIVVHKDDGTVSTSQAVTEVDGVKAVGKAQ